MDGQTPQLLQIIGEDAIQAYRRMTKVLEQAEKALADSRKTAIRRTVTVADAARELGMDYKTFMLHDWTIINAPDWPRIKLVYVDEVIAFQKKYETTSSQLHDAKRTRQYKAQSKP